MRPTMGVAAVAGTVALVTGGVAACGSHSGSGQNGGRKGSQAVQAAYTATTSKKTAVFRFEEYIRAKGASGGMRSTTITGRGRADFATKAFALNVNASGGKGTKMLLVHGIEYVRVPKALRSQVPGHKAWVSVNLNKVTQANLGASFSQVASASNDNPTQALSQLLAVSSHVRKVGHSTVASVPTTEYSAQVSLSKVAARVRAKEGPKAARAIRRQIRALGTSTVPVKVWIDAHNLVRQIRYQAPLPAASSSGRQATGKAVLTLTFLSFGRPVQLSPPPASQTANVTNQVIRHAKASSG